MKYTILIASLIGSSMAFTFSGQAQHRLSISSRGMPPLTVLEAEQNNPGFVRRIFKRLTRQQVEEQEEEKVVQGTQPVLRPRSVVESNPEVSAIQQQQVEVETSLVKEEKKEMSKSDELMQKVKDAGTAGIISYALWEFGFWFLSVPVCIVGYKSITGHWPDLGNADDQKQLAAEAFAFVNFARFAVPLRIGLALGTTPWIQTNIVDRFFKKTDEQEEEEQ